MINLIIHLGLQKTGTKFLQRNVFPNILNVNLIRKYDLNMKLYSNKLNIISDETLSGSSHIMDNLEDRYVIAKRLKKLFPKAYILIGIRKKNDLISSLYRHYIKIGGTLDFDSWFLYYFNNDYVNYDKYVSFLDTLFKRVYVYHLETLRNDPSLFVKGICRFIGCDVPVFESRIVNHGYNNLQVLLCRKVNYITQKIFGGIR